MSLIFFINFRNIAYTQIETELSENIAHARDGLFNRFRNLSALIQRAAFGLAPFMEETPADKKNIEAQLKRIRNSQSDFWLLYAGNDIPWTEPGGFLVFDDGHTLPPDYDQTQRDWVRLAYGSPGSIVYSPPFRGSTSQRPTISVSTVVYGDKAKQLGVVAGSVELSRIETIIDSYITIPQERIFLLNKEGVLLTKFNEAGALEETDFFEHSFLAEYADFREKILYSTSFYNADGEYFLYSVAIPQINWILISMVPKAVVFTRINNVLIEMLLIDFILIVIAVIICVTLTRILQNERDENRAMRDNLNIGFFLLDKGYLIQSQYSKVLENLFNIPRLKGKNFIDLLSGSLKESEQNTLKDYFDMILHQQFDQDLLDDINPIQELAYGPGKTLSCGFTGVRRGRREMVILGSVVDITCEKKLKIQLAEEEERRQEDARFLFEVIQSEPSVLQDFIDDMDYGFDKINSVLTDDDIQPQEAAVNLYQEIHAIKSNAVILGLATFGEKLHHLESAIRSIRDQPNVVYEDLVGLYEGLRRIKQDQKKVLEAIKKIKSFNTDMKQFQGAFMLAQSLTKACERVSADTAKSVLFMVEKIDPRSIDHGPRREMKEVLMQLIRNAVYHGIESPEERQALGKEQDGRITLSINCENGYIRIRLTDDGKGLDYAKIQAKAEALGFIPPGAATDRDALLQAIFAPGFSTADEAGMHAGRGIGLNLVKDRIRGLGGSIDVHSEPNKGTTFNIAIPLPVSEVSQASQAS
jgi:two-component system chemotaxis sensor kinase CheA